jgi:exopolysaccharide production protein ExoQ
VQIPIDTPHTLPLGIQSSAHTFPTPVAHLRKVSRLVVSYVLLMPLLLIAADGSFSFENIATSTRVNELPSHDQNRLYNLLLLIILAVISYLIMSRWPRIRTLLLRYKVLTALPLLAACSLLWTQDSLSTIVGSTILASNWLLVLYVSDRFDSSQQLRLLMLLGAVYSAGSILLAIIPPHYGVSQQTSFGEWRGLSAHKNLYATALAFLLPPCMFASASGNVSRGLRLAYAIVIIFQSLMTQSRTGWVLLAITIFFYATFSLVSQFQTRDASAIAIIGFGALGIGVPGLVAYLPSVLNIVGRDATLSGRTLIWAAVLRSIMKRPLLGYGYGGFWRGMSGGSADVISSFGVALTHAHNGFLNVCLDLGLLGTFLVVITLVQSFWNMALCFQRGQLSSIGWHMITILLMIFQSIDERGMLSPNSISWTFYLLACVGLAKTANAAPAAKRIKVTSNT